MALLKKMAIIGFMILIIGLVLLFTSNNDQIVTVDFLFFQTTGRLNFILGSVFLVGVILTNLYHWIKNFFSQHALKSARKEVASLKAKIQSLEDKAKK